MRVKTKCYYCDKEIIIKMPFDAYEKMKGNNFGCSCNNCVPVNSAVRDGINESIYTEASQNMINIFEMFFVSITKIASAICNFIKI